MTEIFLINVNVRKHSIWLRDEKRLDKSEHISRKVDRFIAYSDDMPELLVMSETRKQMLDTLSTAVMELYNKTHSNQAARAHICGDINGDVWTATLVPYVSPKSSTIENINFRVISAIKDVFFIDDEIDPGKILRSSFLDLGADSLDRMELIMALEEKFNIDFPEEDIKGIDTVQKIIDYIYNKRGNI